MDFVMQLIKYTLEICGGLTIIAGGATVIVNLINKTRKPDADRDEKLKRHDEMLDNDNRRLKSLEEHQVETDEAMRIMMKSMLALMSHELDGNHRDELENARDNLHDYLLRR